MFEALVGLLLGAFPTLGAPPATCSAQNLTLPLPEQADLPPGVAALRQKIAEAAVQCDFAQLEQLAIAGKPGFSYTFGPTSSPAKFWRQQEAQGANSLWFLYKILSRPFHLEGEGKDALYVWPSAYRDNPTDADWKAIQGIYPESQIQNLQEIGVYLGHRIGITPDGDWLFFIAGD